MNRLEILLLIMARLEGIAASGLVDLEIVLRRHGYDDDEVQAALEQARALNRDALRDALAWIESAMNDAGIESVRSLSFSDRPKPAPAITLH